MTHGAGGPAARPLQAGAGVAGSGGRLQRGGGACCGPSRKGEGVDAAHAVRASCHWAREERGAGASRWPEQRPRGAGADCVRVRLLAGCAKVKDPAEEALLLLLGVECSEPLPLVLGQWATAAGMATGEVGAAEGALAGAALNVQHRRSGMSSSPMASTVSPCGRERRAGG